MRSEEHTSELQSPCNLVCRLLLEKKKALHLAPLGNFEVALVVATVSFVLLPTFGALSDAFGRWPIVLGSAALVIVTSYPALAWLVAPPGLPRLLIVGYWVAMSYFADDAALVPLIPVKLLGKSIDLGSGII